MTVRRTSTVYCDLCGKTRSGKTGATSDLRRLGWLVWRSATGRIRHLCPACPHERAHLL